MRTKTALRCAALLLVAAGLPAAAAAPSGAPQQVTVQVGPTPIPGGSAAGAADLTLANDRLAVTFAVDTAAPWGVPRGGILDAAVVRDGVIGPDLLSLLDFLPDGWAKWIAAEARVEVLQDDGRTARVRTTRQWRGVRIVSEWRLDAGRSMLAVVTEMHHEGAATLENLLSGHVLWPDGGYLFGPPGLHGRSEGPTVDALAPWAAAYGENWLLALHAPYADRMRDEGRDRYLEHDLPPGASRRFEAWFQVEAGSSLAPVVAAEIGYADLPSARLTGRVTTRDGAAVPEPAVVAEAAQGDGFVPYAWTLGRDGQYAFELPAGRYRLYATARGHSRSAPFDLELSDGSSRQQDFGGLLPPGALRIHVQDAATGRPLDARITSETDEAPLIRTLGAQTFFTELDPSGQVRLVLAPGNHRFRIESSAGFTARPAWLEATVAPRALETASARIEVLADPPSGGWYGADMHHHSDVLDGMTEPTYVLRSQLAAGLDVTLLSDHDSVANNAEMARLAALRGIPFIAGTELSPSWAHFNAYPLQPGRPVSFDPEQATVQEIFGEARRLGAEVVQVNHPWLTYGYFHTADAGQVPGGYSDAFDLIEITADDLQANWPTIHRAWELWNAGQRAYFSAGSDAHDVWTEASGTARMYVRVDGALSVDRFVAALKRGNAYATTGPLVFPEILFGDDLRHPADAPLDLGYRFRSVNGVVAVRLIEGGREVATRQFDSPQEEAELRFQAWPEANTWYGILAEDAAGKFLVSNPVWVTIERAP
jgi:predicted metal-dependent phosphoesterase TrpH